MPADSLQMTPDERDRLVRLEEQSKNAGEDARHTRAMAEKMMQRLDAQDAAINRIEVALKTAASFTAGQLWVFTRAVAVILAGLTAIGWLAERLPLWFPQWFKH